MEAPASRSELQKTHGQEQGQTVRNRAKSDDQRTASGQWIRPEDNSCNKGCCSKWARLRTPILLPHRKSPPTAPGSACYGGFAMAREFPPSHDATMTHRDSPRENR